MKRIGRASFISRMKSWEKAHEKAVALATVAMAVVIYTTICWLNIDRFSIWFDESFGAYLAHFNIFEITRYTAIDVHPPLYYYLLKGFTMLFGYSDVAVRSLSLLCGIGVIIVGFLLSRRLFSRAAGYLVLPLLVLSPLMLRYGIEARMYMLEALLLLGSTYALIRASSQKKPAKWWTIYGVLSGLALWTHYFAALVIGAQWLWRLCSTWRQTGFNRRLVKNFFGDGFKKAAILTVVIFLPWLPIMLWQFRTVQKGFWIPEVGADTLTDYATNSLFYLSHDEVKSWLALLLIIIVVGFIVLWIKARTAVIARQKTRLELLTAIAALPLVFLFLMSLPPLKSAFVERYVLTSTIVWLILLAVVVAIRTGRHSWLGRSAIYVLVVFCLGVGAINYARIGNYTGEADVKTLAREIGERSPNAGPIIVDEATLFYNAMVYDTSDHPVRVFRQSLKHNWGSLQMIRDSHDRLLGLDDLKTGQTFWYISTSSGAEKPLADNWRQLQRFTLGSGQTSAVEYIIVE